MAAIAQLPFAAAAIADGSPGDARREIRTGIGVVAAFAAIAIGWAAFAPLGSAASAPGEIKVSGERQAMQSLRGGIVSALPVREGAQVSAGELLVGFASAEAIAEERALATRVIDLEAEIARLEADRLGLAHVAPPAAFAALRPEDRTEAARAIAAEQATYDQIRTDRVARRQLFASQAAEANAQITGIAERSRATDAQAQLNRQQLDSLRSLAERGLIPRTRIITLQSNAASLEGDLGAYAAETGRLRQTARQAALRGVQDRSETAQASADRLREARGELQALLPQLRAAREALAQTEIRAPVAGAVVGLKVHTVGGVAVPGATLMEIVPANRALTIEAHIAPADVNAIRIGQAAEVRVPAVHDRSIPSLDGQVVRVSADAFVEERSGRSYYTASIRVPAEELDRFARAAGLAGQLRPGTPVSVQIPLRARTALQFWLEPMMQALSHAGAEQ